MTRYTASIIKNDSNVYASALGPYPNGKYGVYIGTYNFSPSGSPRPHTLLTSDGIFDTSEEALVQAEAQIQKIKDIPFEELMRQGNMEARNDRV